jgi:hypothetical protein
VVEALQARSELGRRELEELAVVDAFRDGEAALRAYLRLHREAPERELYVLHSDREEPDITERAWLGLRTADEYPITASPPMASSGLTSS